MSEVNRVLSSNYVEKYTIDISLRQNKMFLGVSEMYVS